MAEMVMSLPRRLTSATSRGTTQSSSGTCPGVNQSEKSSKISTGSPSRIAALISPLASKGLAGVAILSPGTFMNMGLARAKATASSTVCFSSATISSISAWPSTPISTRRLGKFFAGSRFRVQSFTSSSEP
jgi:hypothetical protein